MIDGKTVLAVIPARGGSQQVPNKSIQPVAGRPAITYTIDEARSARLVDRFVVSTEDRRIARTAQSLAAPVLARPPELSSETARLDGVLEHAVRTLQDRDGFRPDVVVMLYGSVPIRPPGFVDQCIERLVKTGADSVRSVAPVGEHHPAWMVRLDGDRLAPYEPEANVYRRQDLPPLYLFTGACVCMRTDVLMNPDADRSNHFYYLGSDQRAAVHAPEACVEIHDFQDLLWAEFLLSAGPPRRLGPGVRKR
jgi:CMP-N,N'-diacetyllegionaminic acid synthase